MRLTQFLKRCVSAAAVECPYNKIDMVDKVFLKGCVSASVVELHWGGSADLLCLVLCAALLLPLTVLLAMTTIKS